MSLHIKYCQQFGISLEEIEATEEKEGENSIIISEPVGGELT